MNEQTEQWLTGFFEGDGSVGAYYDSSVDKLVPNIRFTQKEKSVLEDVRNLLGFGYIGTQNASYLQIRGWKRCAKLLTLFCKYTVSDQMIIRINDVFEKFDPGVRAEKHRPSMPWTIGFFDAEKHIDWNSYGDLHANFTQKDRVVLEDIRTLVGGNIHSDRSTYKGEPYDYFKLYLSGSELRSFIPHVLEYSHYELEKQKLITMIYALAREGNGVWGKWAKEFVGGIGK